VSHPPTGLKPDSDSDFRPVGGVCLTLDNLGEAAELEGGAVVAHPGRHFTATEVVPEILAMLAERRLRATFFVEGLNAELYPDLLRKIDAGGHEVAFHAWRHEQWGDLTAAEQSENLTRGLAAFERLGLEIAGMRPPGGALGAGGLEVLREAGLRYCSPAGAGASAVDGIALLPFQWRHVDAACTLPPLTAAREQMTGSPDPIDPAVFLASLLEEIGELRRRGGYIAIVLHPVMLDWFGSERLAILLDRVAAAATDGKLWVARCADVAEQVLDRTARFETGTALDTASWSAGNVQDAG
jgi:peptidoglycan/xylan/chitin deacetylase (PgdA/CDA1 family)